MVDPAHFQRLYRAARADGPEALAAFIGLCNVYSALANRALCESLEPERRQAVDSGPLLVTAREAKGFIGPSFSIQKLYRLAPEMPTGCVVRKGGRMYFHLPKLREWTAKL